MSVWLKMKILKLIVISLSIFGLIIWQNIPFLYIKDKSLPITTTLNFKYKIFSNKTHWASLNQYIVGIIYIVADTTLDYTPHAGIHMTTLNSKKFRLTLFILSTFFIVFLFYYDETVHLPSPIMMALTSVFFFLFFKAIYHFSHFVILNQSLIFFLTLWKSLFL